MISVNLCIKIPYYLASLAQAKVSKVQCKCEHSVIKQYLLTDHITYKEHITFKERTHHKYKEHITYKERDVNINRKRAANIFGE